MSFARPFAYNTGSTISGTEQLGDLAIGVDDLDYTGGVGGSGANAGTQNAGVNGTSNTGNGGKAGGATSTNSTGGGNGGSGIVVLKYYI